MRGYKRWISKSLRRILEMPPQADELFEIIRSVDRTLTGVGGLARECAPIHSRIANETVDRPNQWFIPVGTTEANTRLVSCSRSNGSTFHVVVWDEWYSRHLCRLIATHEAWLRTRSDFKSAVRAVKVIASEFVLEQLCPKNRLSQMPGNSARARRIFGNIFFQCKTIRGENQAILNTMLGSPAMADPEVRKLLAYTQQCCRGLTLDHEIHHFQRRYPAEYRRRSGLSFADSERLILDLVSGYEKFVCSGVLPSGRVWSFFETVLRQVPVSFLRADFEGTPIGEELQCDLIPILLLCNESKDVVRSWNITGRDEFRAIAMAYQTARVWQITSAFLQGLRIDVGRAMGRGKRLTKFADSDLGLRLMIGNFMCFTVLASPPYSKRPPRPLNGEDSLFLQIEEARRISEALPRLRGEPKYSPAMKHRQRFLLQYELTSHAWLNILNTVGLELEDLLTAAADTDTFAAPPPDFETYLNFLGISEVRPMP